MSLFTWLRRLLRGRLVPATVVSSVVASALAVLTLSGSLSGFAASITNSTNTAGTGTLVMQESNATGTVTCTSDSGGVSTNTATCAGINKFGGSTTMVPGTPIATTVDISNVGTVPANTFTLAPGGSCTQSDNGSVNGAATDLCSQMTVSITVGTSTTPVFSGTLAALAALSTPITLPTPVAAGAKVPVTFTVELPSSAGNSYQGLQASLPLTWTFDS